MVGIESYLHQYQEMDVEEHPHDEFTVASNITYDGNQGVGIGDSTVEIKCVYLSHCLLKIDDYKEREQPCQKYQLGGAVGECHLDGIATLLIYDGDLEITQDGEDDKDGG